MVTFIEGGTRRTKENYIFRLDVVTEDVRVWESYSIFFCRYFLFFALQRDEVSRQKSGTKFLVLTRFVKLFLHDIDIINIVVNNIVNIVHQGRCVRGVLPTLFNNDIRTILEVLMYFIRSSYISIT